MKLLISTIIFLTASCFADSQIAMCEKEALKFGDGNGTDSLPIDCKLHIEKLAGKKTKVSSKDRRVSLTAYKNMIFIEDPKSKIKGLNVIAGKYTELTDIKEVLLDEKHQEIVVLESSGDILFFSSVITGNVAPKRILRHDALETASTLRLYQDQVYVLDESKEELLVFSRLANVNGFEGKKNLALLSRMKNVKGNELELDEKTKSLLVLSSGKKVTIDLGDKGIRSPASAE